MFWETDFTGSDGLKLIFTKEHKMDYWDVKTYVSDI